MEYREKASIFCQEFFHPCMTLYDSFEPMPDNILPSLRFINCNGEWQ